MMKRLMTTAAALLIGFPALASEDGMETARGVLTEGAPAAAEVAMPDAAEGQTNDGQQQKADEGQTGVEGSDDHGGEAGSVETAGSAAEGESGASSTNVEGKR